MVLRYISNHEVDGISYRLEVFNRQNENGGRVITSTGKGVCLKGKLYSIVSWRGAKKEVSDVNLTKKDLVTPNHLDEIVREIVSNLEVSGIRKDMIYN